MISTLKATYTSDPNDADPNIAPLASDADSVMQMSRWGAIDGVRFFLDHDGTGGEGVYSFTVWVYDVTSTKWVAFQTWTGAGRREIWGDFTHALMADAVHIQVVKTSGTPTIDSDHPAKLYVEERRQ